VGAQAARLAAGHAVERCRQALIEADRQVRVLEILRQRQEAAFCQQHAQRERQAAEEAGTIRYWQDAIAAGD
jgi:flagellar biosynthesis chaperone FliJ